MFTLKVGTAETYLDHDSGNTMLRVPFEILDGETVVSEQVHGFALGTSADDIKAAMQKALATYTEDHERYEANKERLAQEAAAQETVESISNLTIE